MQIKLFDSFKYVVGNSFSFRNKREVKVFFIYKEAYSIPLSLMIKKLNFRKDEQYYIDEAKKIIDKMIKDGSLEKYAEEYIKEKKRKGLLLFWIPFGSACAIAGMSIGIYFAYNPPVAPQPVVEQYEVTCNTTGVTLDKTEAKKGEDYITQLTFTPTTSVTLPHQLDKVLINGIETTDYTYTLNYRSLTADFFISGEYITGKVEIFLTPSEIKKWYEHDGWYNYCSTGVDGEEADDEDIGYDDITLTVNNQEHKIRLIGLDHDELSDGSGKAHTTFQFANALCDSEGHSFGVIEDFELEGYAERNYDYLTSSLRKNLIGKGDRDIMWFQRGDINRSQEYSSMTVMDMLPQELKSILKEVKKEIYTDADQKWDFQPTYYDDKLFVPTYREMFKIGSEHDGDFFEEGTTYEYYLGDDPIRAFNQISDDEYNDTPSIEDIFKGYITPYNYAGYCTSSEHPIGDISVVFASPTKESHGNVFSIYYGTFEYPVPTNDFAFWITPCFCI